MDVGRDLKNYKKVRNGQISRVECGQCVDIERICLSSLINKQLCGITGSCSFFPPVKSCLIWAISYGSK